MDTILTTLKKPAKNITTYAFFAAAFFSLLAHAGNFGNSFMPVVGNLLTLFFDLALLIVIPVFLLMKKQEWAKIAFVPIFSYWLINGIFDFLSSTAVIRRGVNGVLIAASVFEFLIALALLTAAVLFILSKINKNKMFETLSFVILFASFALFFIAFVLNIAYYAIVDVAWNGYFYLFRTYLALPAAMAFAALFFVGGEEKTVAPEQTKDTTTEEAPIVTEATETEKTEEAVEEQKIEEEVAQEEVVAEPETTEETVEEEPVNESETKVNLVKEPTEEETSEEETTEQGNEVAEETIEEQKTEEPVQESEKEETNEEITEEETTESAKSEDEETVLIDAAGNRIQ